MKKTPNAIALLVVSFALVPMVVHAQDFTQGLNSLNTLVRTLTTGIVSSLATLFATMAMAAFFWGIVQYIWGLRNGDAKTHENGKNFMLWGLIALFVMFSVWGIVKYAQTIFGIPGNTITIPKIELQGASPSSSPSPSAGVVAPGTTEYTCPDGVTKYYNQSDFAIVCRGTTSPSPSPSGGSGFNNGCDPQDASCGVNAP